MHLLVALPYPRVLIFSTAFVRKILHCKKNSARYYQKVIKITRCSCHMLMKLKFSQQIFEKYSKNFMKIRPVGVEFSRAGGRTDMTKLILAFRNFANVPKKTNRKNILLKAVRDSISVPSMFITLC
jgi:hypothetical protein